MKTKRAKPKTKPILLAVFLLLVFLAVWIFKDLPSPTWLSSSPSSSLIYDRNGKLLYEIYAEKNRTPVSLKDLPEYIKWATIASEDKNFYRHHGFDFGGVLRAAYNIIFHQTLQGGSTITQQLVKNALLTPERTLHRKIREIILTYLVEVIYSKDRILEMYLNQAPYGGTAWGIQAAAQTYFNKDAKDLTLAESSLLAGLPASPTRFSPFGAHPELAQQRQERVLQLMVEDGYLDESSKLKVQSSELVYAPPSVGIKAPHFVLYVKDLLAEKYSDTVVEQGGLKVTTTLDLDLQNFAQDTVATEVAKLKKLKVGNGAALVTNPKTGEILAMVGSKDYFAKDIDGNVNVTLRPRQPGSSIKPLNYALAFSKGTLTAATVLNDIPTCFKVAGQPLYCPVNYDGQFHGPVQARFALGNSYNIPAVKVLAMNGLTDFVASASAMGIATFKDPQNYGLSLTLGGGEVKMVDMATAFSAFANLGIRQDLWAIKKVEDQAGKVIFEQKEQEGPRVLSMEVAYLIDHILLDNNARSAAFGPSSFLVVKNHPEVAVKTGTTNDLRDNWTIGWTPSVLVATWVGNNDNTAMSYVASGVTGASPIWNKIIGQALKNKTQQWPLKPDGIIGAQVCNVSGKLPNPDSPCPTRFEYFAPGTVPTEMENLNTDVEVDKTTRQLATDKTPPENRETQNHPAIFDPLGIPYCLDCAFPTDPVTIQPSQISSNISR
ncbi:penicillin-binding protein [Candidatus Shapirobacteria bacterium CG09_land_8_20_14_0_10_47_13]|uniref:Penicillin-binding protein n=1 Tax=Candidatus Shapirobacteria bacterium CG09_land_8_20_14_0_10_47_13 TaxID=1974481 RepID=A0A2H0WPE7_9BACT|nr:MAG: penicillin-binding protein [Candidatus Shapirobacteria bacterium CG09_land_8_20_14_0_10_47_13]